MNLFENYVDNGLNFARKKCVQAMQQVLFYILPTTLKQQQNSSYIVLQLNQAHDHSGIPQPL